MVQSTFYVLFQNSVLELPQKVNSSRNMQFTHQQNGVCMVGWLLDHVTAWVIVAVLGLLIQPFTDLNSLVLITDIPI